MGRTKGGKPGPGSGKFGGGAGRNNSRREHWVIRQVMPPGEPNKDTPVSVRESRARRMFAKLHRKGDNLVLIAPESQRMRLARVQRMIDKDRGILPPKRQSPPVDWGDHPQAEAAD